MGDCRRRQQLSGWDGEHRQHLLEDVQLVNRALKHGLRIVYDPAVMVLHRIGEGRLQKGYFRKMEFDAAQGEIHATSVERGRPVSGAPLWLYPVVLMAFWKWAAMF